MTPATRAAIDRAAHTLLVTAPDGATFEVVNASGVAEHAVMPDVDIGAEPDPTNVMVSCRIRAGETCEHGYTCRRAWP